MFSKPLFIQTLKSNLKLFLSLTAVVCVLIAIIMSVFDPETMQGIKDSSGQLPFNPLGDVSTLIKFVANQYFGMMALIFPLIYSIITGNKLIAGQVDKGNMAYSLSTPTTRTQITVTGALYLTGSLAAMFGLIAAAGCGTAAVVQPGVLDYSTFLMMTLGEFLLQFAFGGIIFLGSCVFNRSGKSLAFGAGIPLFFFACHLLSGMSDSLEFLKNFSLITLFDTGAVMNGEGYAVKFLILGAVGLVCFLSGMKVFKEKDLPL